MTPTTQYVIEYRENGRTERSRATFDTRESAENAAVLYRLSCFMTDVRVVVDGYAEAR